MGKRSSLSPAERSRLVLSLLRKEEPASRIARRAGISEQTLYRWRDDFINAGKQAMSGRVFGLSKPRCSSAWPVRLRSATK